MPGPGRRFEAGNNMNPRGRPPSGASLAEAIRRRAGEDGALFLDRLFEIAQGTDKRLALSAIELLITRAYGKVPDTTVTVNTAALADLSDSELEVALKVAERLSAA